MANDFRGVSIASDDFKEYQAMIASWSAEHDGIKISMAEMIKLAMTAYREAKGL